MKRVLHNVLCIWACSLLVFTLAAQAQNAHSDEGGISSKLVNLINQHYDYLERLYKYLHTHPELSFHELNTSKRIATELKNLGFEVTTHVGGNGIVGVFKNGQGPTVLVRTDLDALPVKEQTGLPYASQVRVKDDQGNEVNVMHACGHDMHMTVFVGTATLLTQLKKEWHGTLVMIGQPAEEKGGGAKAMIADGLFERFPRPDYALALHVNASMPAGTVGYREGYALANVDAVDILIRGAGGHGAYPQATKDPIVLAAETVMALQTIVSREIPPIEPAVVTVGSIHGGTKHNIIPDEVKLQLTLRSYSDKVRNHTIEAIRRITKGLAIAAGVPEDRMPIVTVGDEYTPATYNDPELTRRVAKVIGQVLGEKNVIRTEPVMGGEDFGRYGRVEPKIPICIFWLGAVDPQKVAESRKTGKPLPSLHSSLFAPLPEPTIKTGVKAMTAAVLELMSK
ncbi:MAG: amidohydrolase [Calditrichaeota bacterium]|nr:MAG: amidohydrolase [Calditrichota bacterium]